MGSPATGAPNAVGVGKNCIFWPVESSLTQTPYRRKLVSICHGGPHLRWCAGGGRCDVINNFGDSLTLMITVMVQLISTRLVVWKSIDDTHCLLMYLMQSIACLLCGSWASYRTTCVQNYAGSRIKHGNCWKCSSDWQAIGMGNSHQQ